MDSTTHIKFWLYKAKGKKVQCVLPGFAHGGDADLQEMNPLML